MDGKQEERRPPGAETIVVTIPAVRLEPMLYERIAKLDLAEAIQGVFAETAPPDRLRGAVAVGALLEYAGIDVELAEDPDGVYRLSLRQE